MGSPRSCYGSMSNMVGRVTLRTAYLRNIIVLLALLPIVVDEYASHTEVGNDGWVFL